MLFEMFLFLKDCVPGYIEDTADNHPPRFSTSVCIHCRDHFGDAHGGGFAECRFETIKERVLSRCQLNGSLVGATSPPLSAADAMRKSVGRAKKTSFRIRVGLGIW
jgi:hypothetical protein